jgi:hypothetical protein
LVKAKIVPAVSEVWVRQALHCHNARLSSSQCAEPPHAGHSKPPANARRKAPHDISIPCRRAARTPHPTGLVQTAPCRVPWCISLSALTISAIRKAGSWRRLVGNQESETFKFLGFVLICGKSRRGVFLVMRTSRRDRMHATLKEIKEELQRGRHQPIPEPGRWLGQSSPATLRITPCRPTEQRGTECLPVPARGQGRSRVPNWVRSDLRGGGWQQPSYRERYNCPGLLCYPYSLLASSSLALCFAMTSPARPRGANSQAIWQAPGHQRKEST